MADEMKRWRVLVVGDSGVGKTSIIIRFAEKDFADNYLLTIGHADLRVADINVDGVAHKMQVWDTYGGERWSARLVGPPYYRHTAATILVYDVTKRKSYDSLLENWLPGFRINTVNADRKVIPCIVGNKSDLHDQRQVFREEAEAFARSIGALFYEASARTGDNVDQIFEEIVRRALIEDGKAQTSAAASRTALTHANRDQRTKGTSCILS